jgi:hypothetical protein
MKKEEIHRRGRGGRREGARRSRKERAEVRVHGPRVTVVQKRTRCGRMKADPADVGTEVTSKGASVCRTDAREA